VTASADIVIGIDAGSSSVKAVLATADGRVLGHGQVPYTSVRGADGADEQNPHDWWDGAVRAVRSALSASALPADRVAAIAVSGQGCAATLIDADGQVVRPAITSRDSRSQEQSLQLQRIAGDDIRRVNGKTPAPYNTDPSLMWLVQNEPRSIERARTSLTTSGYLLFRLSGEPVLSASDASILFAFDQLRGDWSDDLITRFGLPRKLYPTVVASTSRVGGLTRDAAGALGLHTGLPVVAGGEDTSSAALALGTVLPGQAVVSLGTAGTINAVVDHFATEPDLLTFAHVVPKRFLIGGSTMAFGGSLSWLRSAAAEDGLSFDDLFSRAASVPVGAGGLMFLPYLAGELQPINDGAARGAFVGLTFGTRMGHLVRAVLEGAAMSLAHNLWLLRSRGHEITELRAVGGPTRSALWCQIIADVLGVRLLVGSDVGGAPLGNALLAAQGVGLIDDAAKVALKAARPVARYEPRTSEHQTYQRLLEVYRGLYPALAPSFHSLSAFSQGTA
jgi:xylulokinase